MPRLWAASVAVAVLCAAAVSAAPVIYWASDPVQPGEAVLVAGEGFCSKPAVSVVRRPDDPAQTPGSPARAPATAAAVSAEVLQASDTGLKFLLPAKLKPGCFHFTVKTEAGTTAGADLNRPALWWYRGVDGDVTAAGTPLRLFGRNLSSSAGRTRVFFQGAVRRSLPAAATAYSATVTLPPLPLGTYKVYLHNGFGEARGWSEPLSIRVGRSRLRPSRALNARDLGADGTGGRDDTAALQAALDKAGREQCDVLLPRGRYQCTGTLRVPPGVFLRGEKRELTALFWPDVATPPEALIRGTHSFGLTDLTIYAGNHRNLIQGNLGKEKDSGNVTLQRLRVRGNAYRGHLEPAQVDERFRQSLKWSTGGGDTVQVGGENVVITDCDLYGSGRSLYLSRARHSLVANNTLYNGRWGWYCLEGSDGLAFEDNVLQGADLMSTGGGIANYSTACSRNIYFARNDMRLCHGWDREVMTTDAGGEAYFGKAAVSDGAVLTLAEDPRWGGRDWTGGGVFILAGTGAGQWRFISGYDGRRVTLDRPWQRPPDPQSVLGITMFHGRYAFIGNKFTDCGAFQFYGTSVECDVVGNTAARNQGYQALGLWYHGFQPSWYCQFLGNRIAEGNYYHWDSAADSLINIYGARREGYEGPLTRGAVVRGNTLLANSHIRISGSCANILVAQNRVENSDTGIFVSSACTDVLLRGNTFKAVTREVSDEAAERRAAHERLARYLNRPDPVLALSFEQVTEKTTPDSSGNGFDARLEGGVKQVDEGVSGKAVALDGTGYLQVGEPAVFNAPDLTVDLRVKPATLRGRRGLVVKRFGNSACPFVIGHSGAALSFEATDEQGKWSFNFVTPPVLKENVWSHVTVVMKAGQGVRIFCDGKLVGEKQNPLARTENAEPLVLGREAWGGDPPSTAGPGMFIGQLDEVRVWTRALTDAEVAAEQAK